MMNIETLGLSPENAAILNARVAAHSRYSNIEFKILEQTDSKMVLRITQGKNHSGNYFDNKRLSEIGKELFEGIREWKIITRPIPYTPIPTDVVTVEWIEDKVAKHGLKTKDLANALGIDANTVSAYRHGLKTLTAPVKAAFYYYFNSKK